MVTLMPTLSSLPCHDIVCSEDAHLKVSNVPSSKDGPAMAIIVQVTLRLKGKLNARGARLGLLAQAQNTAQSVEGRAINVNSVMAFPEAVTEA